MWNMKILGIILKHLKRIRGKSVGENMGGTVCDECRVIIGPDSNTEYYRLSGKDYCSLNCFYEDGKPVETKIKNPAKASAKKKRKGKKK